jgi:hypothetical protein
VPHSSCYVTWYEWVYWCPILISRMTGDRKRIIVAHCVIALWRHYYYALAKFYCRGRVEGHFSGYPSHKTYTCQNGLLQMLKIRLRLYNLCCKNLNIATRICAYHYFVLDWCASHEQISAFLFTLRYDTRANIQRLKNYGDWKCMSSFSNYCGTEDRNSARDSHCFIGTATESDV